MPRPDFEALWVLLNDLEDMAAAVLRHLVAGRAEASPAAIATLRDHRGFDLAALAARSGLPPDRLGRIEAGDEPIGFAEMARIATALAVPLDFLAPSLDVKAALGAGQAAAPASRSCTLRVPHDVQASARPRHA